MKLKTMATLGALALFAGVTAVSCQSVPDNMTVADYCAVADNANKDVCKVMVEVDGQKRSLATTNLTLTEARGVADNALAAAKAAQASADALGTKLDQVAMTCETKTIQRSKTGACADGWKLMSCTQTRYTYRAGGPSIMRGIDDKECRFQGQVLEMQVRCCAAGANPPPAPLEVSAPVPAEPDAKPTNSPSS